MLKDFGDGEGDIVILIGTGSEVQYCVSAAEKLAEEGISARVVSMPCREWFDEQDQDYRDSVIPPTVRARVSIEAGVERRLARPGRRRRQDHLHRALRCERRGGEALRGVRLQRRDRGRGRPTEPGRRRGRQRLDPHRRERSQGTGRSRRRPGRHDQLTTAPPSTEGIKHERSTEGPRRRRRLHLARRPVPRSDPVGQPGRTGRRFVGHRGDDQPDDLRRRAGQG